MKVVWNDHKSRLNLKKHGISFDVASQVFDDPWQISQQDRHVQGEERWQTLGMVGGVLVLLVAHTVYEDEHEEICRIISARKATPHERKVYAQHCLAKH